MCLSLGRMNSYRDAVRMLVGVEAERSDVIETSRGAGQPIGPSTPIKSNTYLKLPTGSRLTVSMNEPIRLVRL